MKKSLLIAVLGLSACQGLIGNDYRKNIEAELHKRVANPDDLNNVVIGDPRPVKETFYNTPESKAMETKADSLKKQRNFYGAEMDASTTLEERNHYNQLDQKTSNELTQTFNAIKTKAKAFKSDKTLGWEVEVVFGGLDKNKQPQTDTCYFKLDADKNKITDVNGISL
ncbi:hypothetical protein [Mucilaginibacter sp. CSA2-8R]|uniref:hypothetical protein n=1 Tax=Mucilaginibacter sp. CSA2-8R TaxID=3141542 RepID=UPI00315D2462